MGLWRASMHSFPCRNRQFYGFRDMTTSCTRKCTILCAMETNLRLIRMHINQCKTNGCFRSIAFFQETKPCFLHNFICVSLLQLLGQLQNKGKLFLCSLMKAIPVGFLKSFVHHDLSFFSIQGRIDPFVFIIFGQGPETAFHQ